ncbi:MAG TPA: hypothetical protein VFW21_08755 [Mycobacterium sp.]|nr:hypothetical protein [Mycobacterium sp.]
MSKLTVVYLQSTGHVLAAVTRAAPPDSAEQVTALTGPHLPVRGIGGASPVAVSFPADYLAATTVDDEPDVLLDPHGFEVVENVQKDGTTHYLVRRLGVTGNVTPKFDSGKATVKINFQPATPLPMVAVLQRVKSPLPAEIINRPIPKDQPADTPITLDTVDDTSWEVLVFVQSQPPIAVSKSSP